MFMRGTYQFGTTAAAYAARHRLDGPTSIPSQRLFFDMITRLRIQGMSCQHCVRAVFTALAAVHGITRADVRIGSVDVEHDGTVTVDQLREAIAVAGYAIAEAETNRRALPVV